MGRSGVRVARRICSNHRRHIDGQIAFEAGGWCHHQCVHGCTVHTGSKGGRFCTVNHHNVGYYKPSHTLAERERAGNRPTCNIRCPRLVVGDRHRWRQRIYQLHRLGRSGVRVARRICSNPRRHINGHVAFKVGIRCHHHCVLCAADGRERPLGSIRHDNIGRIKPGHRFAEVEGIGHIATCNIRCPRLVIGDYHRRCQRIYRLHRLGRSGVPIARCILSSVCSNINGHVAFEVGSRSYDKCVHRVTVHTGRKGGRFCTVNHHNGGYHKPSHAFAERERVGDRPAGDVRCPGLIVTDRHGRVHCINDEGTTGRSIPPVAGVIHGGDVEVPATVQWGGECIAAPGLFLVLHFCRYPGRILIPRGIEAVYTG